MRRYFSIKYIAAIFFMLTLTIWGSAVYAQSVPAQQIYNFAQSGDYTSLKYLGSAIDTKDANGDTAVCLALARGDRQAYTLLVNYGADPHPRCERKYLAQNNSAAASSGLSTGTVLMAAAIIAGGVGIAVAAGGHGGGGKGGSSTSETCDGYQLDCVSGYVETGKTCRSKDGLVYKECVKRDCSGYPLNTEPKNCADTKSCRSGDVITYKCETCNKGWIGKGCQTPAYCPYNHKSCPIGYVETGETCQSGDDIFVECTENECQGYDLKYVPEKCKTASECYSGSSRRYKCEVCQEGWSGESCEEAAVCPYNTKECAEGYHETGNICKSGNETYKECEVNDCSDYPLKEIPERCTESSSCRSADTITYKCNVCEEGWEGETCKTPAHCDYTTKECGEGYIPTGKTCKSGDRYYKECEPDSCAGFDFTDCPVNAQKCETCESGKTTRYKVQTCSEGWEGADCTTPAHCDYETKECTGAYVPTGNTCRSGEALYRECELRGCKFYGQVECAEGYDATGRTCEVDGVTYQECQLHSCPYHTLKCENGYTPTGNTCTSGSTTYVECKPQSCTGYNLVQCPANAEKCEECTAGTNTKYKVESCRTGWSGTNCQTPGSCPYSTTFCKTGYEETGEICQSGNTTYVECKPKSCADYTLNTCPEHARCGECVSGETTTYKINECEAGWQGADCSTPRICDENIYKTEQNCQYSQGWIIDRSDTCIYDNTALYRCTQATCGSEYKTSCDTVNGWTIDENNSCVSGSKILYKCKAAECGENYKTQCSASEGYEQTGATCMSGGVKLYECQAKSCNGYPLTNKNVGNCADYATCVTAGTSKYKCIGCNGGYNVNSDGTECIPMDCEVYQHKDSSGNCVDNTAAYCSNYGKTLEELHCQTGSGSPCKLPNGTGYYVSCSTCINGYAHDPNTGECKPNSELCSGYTAVACINNTHYTGATCAYDNTYHKCELRQNTEHCSEYETNADKCTGCDSTDYEVRNGYCIKKGAELLCSDLIGSEKAAYDAGYYQEECDQQVGWDLDDSGIACVEDETTKYKCKAHSCSGLPQEQEIGYCTSYGQECITRDANLQPVTYHKCTACSDNKTPNATGTECVDGGTPAACEGYTSVRPSCGVNEYIATCPSDITMYKCETRTKVVENCEQYGSNNTDDGICQSCVDGYTLSVDGDVYRCVISGDMCPYASEELAMAGRCLTPTECNDSTWKCEYGNCETGYIADSSGKCIIDDGTTCEEGEYSLKPHSGWCANSLQCFDGKYICTSCVENNISYHEEAGRCIENDSTYCINNGGMIQGGESDAHCEIRENQTFCVSHGTTYYKCAKCEEGYTKDTYGICQQDAAACPYSSKPSNNEGCNNSEQCSDGSWKCVQCVPTSAHLDTTIPGYCIMNTVEYCQNEGFKKLSEMHCASSDEMPCIAGSELYFKNCTTCEQGYIKNESGDCSLCPSGQYLSNTGTCENIPDSNCPTQGYAYPSINADCPRIDEISSDPGGSPVSTEVDGVTILTFPNGQSICADGNDNGKIYYKCAAQTTQTLMRSMMPRQTGSYYSGDEFVHTEDLELSSVDGITTIGIYADSAKVENTAKIRINKAISTDESEINPTTDAVTPVGYAVGMYATAGSEIINSGNIEIEGAAVAIGMYGEDGTTDNPTVINNKGTIEISASDKAYGIWAAGENVLVSNSGTIIIDGIEQTGTCTGSECGEANNAIVLNGGTLLQNGLMRAPALDLNSMGGVVAASKNTRFEVDDKLSGYLLMSTDVVNGGFADEYKVPDMITAGDVAGLNLISQSALFEAKLQNDSDAVLSRKSFDKVIANHSVAEFLQENYASGNNESLYNLLKEQETATALNNTINSLTGYDVFNRFNFEDMTMMRELNADVNNRLFNDKTEHLTTAGSIAPFYFDSENGSNARYALYNTRIGRKSYGMSLAFSNINGSDRHDRNTRKDETFQLSVPFGYNRYGFKFITAPRFGYAYGTYDRNGYQHTYDGTVEKRMLGLSNELRYPVEYGGWSVAPAAEFNMNGYHVKGHEEPAAYALNIPSQNTYSVEAGFGLYANRELNLGKAQRLKLRAGVAAYHEFADPYTTELEMQQMSGSFKISDERRKDNRAVLRAGFDYNFGEDFSLLGAIASYVDGTTHTNANLNFRFNF